MLNIVEKLVMGIIIWTVLILGIALPVHGATGNTEAEYVNIKGRTYIVTDRYVLPADSSRYT